MAFPELYVPHAGWFRHEPGDEVARFLAEGWFEYKAQALLWLYLRPGDTFLDGGAHVGLYSVLAGRAMNNAGSIAAVEPHPVSASHLEHNLRANGVTCSDRRQSALFSQSGPLTLHAGGPGKSAYSGICPVDGALHAFTVEATTLDDILRGQVQLAKLDVVGAELEVLAGASDSIHRGHLPLLIIECTKVNLAHVGAATESLFTALRQYGYTVCRFDAPTRRLVVRDCSSPIGYDNLFAAQDIEEVNRRLSTAAALNCRIATDILTRGAAAEKLFAAASRLPQLERCAAEAARSADEAFRSLGEANRRADEAENRAQAAERRSSEARAAVQESDRRTEEAHKRAEEATLVTDEAFRRVGEANWRTDEAEKRAEAARQRAHQAEARAAQAERRAEGASCHSENLLRAAELSMERLSAAHLRVARSEESAHQSRNAVLHYAELASQLRLRLDEILASQYLRAGWKLGLARKPAWLGDSPYPVNPLPAQETEMMRALRHLDEKKLQPRVVLDIGAGKGCWSILAGEYFKDAKFYLLEPLTENEPDLRRLCEQDPRHRYILTAVAGESGDRKIRVASNPDSSTMLVSPDSDDRFRSLSVTTVDRLLETARIDPPDLVKIDVQGMELQVLRGGQKLFDHADVFIVEVNLFAFMPGCPRIHEIIQFMAERGYYLFDLAGSLRRPLEDDLGQLDLVMVSARSPLVSSSRWV